MMTRMLRSKRDANGPDLNQNSAAHDTETTCTDADDTVLQSPSSCSGGGGGGSIDETTSVKASSAANANEIRADREERSMALEKTYVHDVYEQIAPHFKANHHRPWQRVNQFLTDLEPGALICDVGCGNGKYLGVNPDVFTVGSDQCSKIAEVAKERGHEVVTCDNLALPFRDETFDAALSVAVVHHFATTERRVQAVRELARILRIGGRLMITVWSLEQTHRKFESQDVLVPWHKPVHSSSEEQTSMDKDVASTTTSDDDQYHYHAYTSGLDSEPYFVPTCESRKKHRFKDTWVQYRSRNLDSCRSSSQSSSDLSSPNETCYSFVRRALKKLSSSRTWDDPHQRCRPPWFLQNVDSGLNGGSCIGSGTSFFGGGNHALQTEDMKQDSLESNENADDIPIELHDVDSEMCDGDRSELGHNDEKSPLSSSCLKDSSIKSHSVKCLKRSSSTDSSSATLGLKSKSLSDLLSLFTANFLYSRKISQDSTSGSSTSSLARKSSSSSIESKTVVNKQSGPSRNSGVARSKSSHFTLAKVEEGNEQAVLQQMSHGTSPTMGSKNIAKQQRWSVTGYSSVGCGKVCRRYNTDEKNTNDSMKGSVRRPRSLVLGKEVRIPRTLSAEDHKNGNTILPDLDSCLNFYGLKTGSRSDNSFPSPPYTKAESESKEIDAEKHTTPNEIMMDRLNGISNCNDAIYRHDYKKKRDFGKEQCPMKCRPTVSNSANSHCNVSKNSTHKTSTTEGIYNGNKSHTNEKLFSNQCSSIRNDEHKLTFGEKQNSFCGKVKLQKDTLKDIFDFNVINQIIVKEHLFPYRSMPNLNCHDEAGNLTANSYRRPKHLDRLQQINQCQTSDSVMKDGNFLAGRRHSQPTSSSSSFIDSYSSSMTKIKKLNAIVNSDAINGIKKRSFSVDIDHSLGDAHCAGTLDERFFCGLTHHDSSCKRSWLSRRRSVVFSCSGHKSVKPIKHSFSTGDSSLKVLASTVTQPPVSSFCRYRFQNGGNKVIIKEDSLQSDTSVDSDDSVASVIAVRQEGYISSDASVSNSCSCSTTHLKRLGSACSKESSNLSDTSVDSEDSCVSVIAMPLKVDISDCEGFMEADMSGTTENEKQLESNENSFSIEDLNALKGVHEEDEAFACYRLDPNFITEEDNKKPPEESLKDDKLVNQKFENVACNEDFYDSIRESPDAFDTAMMKTSVSWEKYLDACESLVLDSIFYVNVAAESKDDQHVSINHLLPTFNEDYTTCPVPVEFYNSASPIIAETCWLDSTSSSWKSSESIGDESDMEGLPSLKEDLITDTIDHERHMLEEDEVSQLITATLVTCCSPSSTQLSPSEVTPMYAPDLPQGRLLEAASGVANSLQSAVTVVVSNSVQGKGTVEFFETKVEIKDHDPEQNIVSCDMNLISFDDDDDDPQELGCESMPFMTLEMNPIYQCCSPSRSPSTQLEDAALHQIDTRWQCETQYVEPNKKPPEEAVKKCTTKEVAVETDPQPDVPVYFEESTVSACKASELNDLAKDRKHRAHEDVINGNVPGLRYLSYKTAGDSGNNKTYVTDDDTNSLSRSRRFSESYLSSCTAVSTMRRLSIAAPCRSLSHTKLEIFNNLQEVIQGTVCDRKGARECNKSCNVICESHGGNAHEGSKHSFSFNEHRKVFKNMESQTLSNVNHKPEDDYVHLTDVNIPSQQEIPTSFLGKDNTTNIDTNNDRNKKTPADSDIMQTSVTSSIENHFGQLEFMSDGDKDEIDAPLGEDIVNGVRSSGIIGKSGLCFSLCQPQMDDKTIDPICGPWHEDEVDKDERHSVSLSTSEDSILSGSENGGSTTYHRYYHVFREGELDNLIDKYVENLHIISSYYDHANWCIIAEKVQVWRI